jgi:hypothetical protein
MDQETFNLLLGIAGLVIGFISAFGKIKLFTIRAARASGAAAARWANRQGARAALFLAQPSAFIGFLVRRSIWAIFFIAAGFLLPTAFRLNVFVAPHWVATVGGAVPSLIAGVLINTITSVSGDVMKLAKRAQGEK